jgi:hypothetical protein
MQRILEILGNFFTLNSPSLTYPGVWFCVIAVWLLVLICSLTSIWGHRFGRGKKIFWSVIVLAMPLVGVAIYVPFSLGEELFPLLGFWRNPKR